MKCMMLVIILTIVSVHMLKVGLFVFLLLAVCTAANSIAQEHDHQHIECEKNKYVHSKSIFTK